MGRVKDGPAQVIHGLARLAGYHFAAGPPGRLFLKGFSTVKKLLLIGMVGASAFALWRKVQADRAELDLWTEATTDD
jgi:hypothetical protein